MLRGMRKVFERNQKILLVALAALLIAFFAMPQRGCRPQAPDHVGGTLYGAPISIATQKDFMQRWGQLGLPLVELYAGERDSQVLFENLTLPSRQTLRTFFLLQAARQHGIQVGPDAVQKQLLQLPPMRVSIEYVLANPAELAKDIKPSDDDLQAYYDTRWENKVEKFDAVKDRIRDKIVAERAAKLASDRIAQAHKLIAAAPRDNEAWQQAYQIAAKQTGLTYGSVPPFGHALALRMEKAMAFDLTRHPLWPLASPQLPSGFANAAFGTDVGESSQILASGNKRLVFRVTATSAGIQANGKLFRDDEGWRNGRFMTLRTYADYEAVVREKLRMDIALARHGIEEYLVVQKFLDLTCDGSFGPALTSRDVRQQWAARQNQAVTALLAHLPVGPFIDTSTLDKEQLQVFYDAHKQLPPGPLNAKFGYAQPEMVVIKYVTADLSMLDRQVTVAERHIAAYYAKNKDQEFLGQDGKTPKPFAEVRSEIVTKLTRLQARTRANELLTQIRDTSQAPGDKAPSLEDAAAQAGLTIRTSPFFAQADTRAVVRDLAGDMGLAQEAFRPGMRPTPTPDGTQTPGPLSAARYSGDIAFMFRVAKYRKPRAPVFTELSPRSLVQVQRDYAHTLAGRKAQAVAQQTKGDIARALIAAIAAENQLAVQTAEVQQSAGTSAAATGGASTVPPVLAEYVTQTLPETPGGLARLIKDGDTYYTAAITGTTQQTYAIPIAYVRFTEQQFTATIRPSQDKINARARAIRNSAPEAEAAKQDDKDDAPKPEPTEEQVKQAEAELIAAWKKQDFQARYIAYVGQRLAAVFREHLEANPLEIERVVQMRRRTTPVFFHAADTFALGRDPALVEAAFKLKPDELSSVITGKSSAAIMLLAGEESRQERKIAFVSVDPQKYDPLSFTITDADAAKHYAVNPDDFRRPARATAEFVFASFKNIADTVAASVTSEDIEAYYEQRAETIYLDRRLDQRLRDAIRSVLAWNRAKAGAAEQAIGAAYKAAQAGTPPLSQVVVALDKLGLVASTTPALAATDYIIPTVGLDSALVGQITAAEKDQLAEPVRTDNGWIIFRVIEKQPSALPPLEDVMPAARAGVLRQQRGARAEAALQKVHTFLEQHPKITIEKALARPELAADLPGRPAVHTTGFFDKQRAPAQQLKTLLSEAVFATEPGQLTDVVAASDAVQLARVIEAKTNRLLQVHYIRVDAALYTPTIKISTRNAQAHYDANKADYGHPQQYELEYLTPHTLLIEAEIKPSDTDIADTYKQFQFLYPDAGRSGTYRPLDAVRWEVAGLLRTRRGKQEAAKQLAKAQELIAKDAKQSLKDIAAELPKLKLAATVIYEPGNTMNQGVLDGVAGLDAFLAKAKPGETSPVLQASGGLIMVRINKLMPAGPAPFDEVEKQVKKDLAITRGLVDATKLAGEMRSQIAKPTTEAMQTTAAKFQVTTAQIVPIRVADTGVVTLKTLRDAAKGIQQEAQLINLRQQWGLAKPGDFAIGMQGLRMKLADRDALGNLFRMRTGEIGGPDARGNRADACSLSVLTGSRHEPSAGDEQLGLQLGVEARVARLLNLLTMIQADVVTTDGAR